MRKIVATGPYLKWTELAHNEHGDRSYSFIVDLRIMSPLALFFFFENLFFWNGSVLGYDDIDAVNKMHSAEELRNAHVRKKRYAVFPEGSTFTVSIRLRRFYSILNNTVGRQ